MLYFVGDFASEVLDGEAGGLAFGALVGLGVHVAVELLCGGEGGGWVIRFFRIIIIFVNE